MNFWFKKQGLFSQLCWQHDYRGFLLRFTKVSITPANTMDCIPKEARTSSHLEWKPLKLSSPISSLFSQRRSQLQCNRAVALTYFVFCVTSDKMAQYQETNKKLRSIIAARILEMARAHSWLASELYKLSLQHYITLAHILILW